MDAYEICREVDEETSENLLKLWEAVESAEKYGFDNAWLTPDDMLFSFEEGMRCKKYKNMLNWMETQSRNCFDDSRHLTTQYRLSFLRRHGDPEKSMALGPTPVKYRLIIVNTSVRLLVEECEKKKPQDAMDVLELRRNYYNIYQKAEEALKDLDDKSSEEIFEAFSSRRLGGSEQGQQLNTSDNQSSPSSSKNAKHLDLYYEKDLDEEDELLEEDFSTGLRSLVCCSWSRLPRRQEDRLQLEKFEDSESSNDTDDTAGDKKLVLPQQEPWQKKLLRFLFCKSLLNVL